MTRAQRMGHTERVSRGAGLNRVTEKQMWRSEKVRVGVFCRSAGTVFVFGGSLVAPLALCRSRM